MTVPNGNTTCAAYASGRGALLARLVADAFGAVRNASNRS
jgi:hypothetical protein